MSKETKTTETKSSFGIVNAILELLGLGDAGQLDKFFTKQVKGIKRNIRALKQNIDVLKSNFEQAKEELEEKIEDAREYVQNAYLAVKVEDIKNNAAIDDFEYTYWENIKLRERELKSLEDALLEAESDHKDKVEEKEKEIARMNDRIKKITSFKK